MIIPENIRIAHIVQDALNKAGVDYPDNTGELIVDALDEYDNSFRPTKKLPHPFVIWNQARMMDKKSEFFKWIMSFDNSSILEQK